MIRSQRNGYAFFLLTILLFIGGLSVYYLSSEHGGDRFDDDEMEERETGADKQLQMLFQARAYPDPYYLNDKYMAGWQHAVAMRTPEIKTGVDGSSGNSGIQYGAWSQVGNLEVGRVLSIAVSPSNGSNVFLGSASGGIWKSTNGGSSWSFVTTGFPILGVPTIVFNPSNANIILAGTGEVYRSDTSNIGYNVWKARGTYGVGILRSADGGTTWSQVLNKSTSDLFGVQMIRFDPGNSNTVYACTTNGLYKSTDAGATWGASPILNKTYVSDVVINSSDPNQMLAAVGNLVNSDKGIYRTTNGGTTWTKLTSGLPSGFSGFIRFASLASAPSTVYASIGMGVTTSNGGLSYTDNELYKTANFGTSWSVSSSSNHSNYQFWFAHAIAIMPSQPDYLFMAGVSFYRYRVSTATRSSIGTGMHSDFHDIQFDPSNSSIAYIACDGGVYKTTNATASSPTFSSINTGLNIAQFYASFGVSATTANRFIGGLQDNGVWAYNGSSWSKEIGGDGGACVVNPSNDNIVYASNDARTVSKSTSGITGSFSGTLSSWAFVADDRTAFMAPIAISKSNPSTVYVASDNLHKTTNSGSSWTNVNYSTATNYIEARYKTGVTLAVSPTNENKVYVSLSPFSQKVDNTLNITGTPTVFKTTNGGTSFTNITSGLPNRFVLDFAISPNNDDSVMVVLGGYGSSHVYLTGDGGATWIDRGAGLPDVPFNAIVFDKDNSSIVYAGSDVGAYISNDNGQTWFDFNNGLPDGAMIFDLQITADNQLVAATHGKGVFISALPNYSKLPVQISQFTGFNRNDHNQLQWSARDEQDLATYVLERRIDNGLFQPIGNVEVKNTTGGSSYSYSDPVSANTATTNYYYRLKMVSKNGNITYSNVVLIRYIGKSGFRILGNPVTAGSTLQLTVNSAQVSMVRVFDRKGSLLYRYAWSVSPGINQLALGRLGSFAKGIYVIEVMDNGVPIRQQFIVQ